MSYSEHYSKHLRIALLRLLAISPCSQANSSLLHSALADLGMSPTRDQVKTELAWLAEQSLVTALDAGGLVLATLSERGADVAEGRTTVPGVQRPTSKG